jgi:predicted O-linked N-acetylglucosamine transferase (SPINDLY family)
LPKYLPQFDGVFPRIAAEVPDCQFTFIDFGGGSGVTGMFRARLERAFKEAGLSATDHCVFLPRLAPDRFVAAIGQCDVVLDSIGWSGCNSILEGLVHNVPIVTLAGKMMRGRHAAAMLDMMEIRETTAQTIDEYVSIAGVLGRNTRKRTELSARISNQKHRVYRDPHCIAALEDFLAEATRKRALRPS